MDLQKTKTRPYFFAVIIITFTCLVACSSGSRTYLPALSHTIHVQNRNGAVGQALFLEQYLGSSLSIIDTAFLNESYVATFIGGTGLADGLYAISDGQKNRVDFLISANQPQQFGIKYNSIDIVGSLRFKGSPENTAFYDYIGLLNRREKSATDTVQTSSSRLQVTDATIRLKEHDLRQQFAGSMLDLYIQACAPIKLDNVSSNDSIRKADIIAHFWNNINLGDVRIVNLPLFEDKLARYFVEIVPAKQLRASVDSFIRQTVSSEVVAKFCVEYLYELFVSSPYPQHYELACYIAEQFMLNGPMDFGLQQRAVVAYEIQRIRMNPVGEPIPDLSFFTISGQGKSLLMMPSKPMILYFYTPGCSACKATLPELKKLYTRYANSIQVVTISVGSFEGVDNYPNEWVNAAADSEDIYRYFNLLSLPSIYLVDGDKILTAKNLTIEGLYQQIGCLKEFK